MKIWIQHALGGTAIAELLSLGSFCFVFLLVFF